MKSFFAVGISLVHFLMSSTTIAYHSTWDPTTSTRSSTTTCAHRHHSSWRFFIDQRRDCASSKTRTCFQHQAHPSTRATDSTDAVGSQKIDNRPYEQRTKGPRTARRLNHAFKYLYRDKQPWPEGATKDQNGTSPPYNSSVVEYLMQYGEYTFDEILVMNQTFPPLLNLSVSRQLHPKFRFVRETLQLTAQEAKGAIPPHFYGARLEKVLAPRHAFLQHHALPHGRNLVIHRPLLWREFLQAGRTTKAFAAFSRRLNHASNNISHKHVEAFDALFGRGLMSAARNELVQPNNTWPLDYVSITSSELTSLLIDHGANPHERDHRGVSLLHWACACGNLETVKVLLQYIGVNATTERDGATPLHWASAGANVREFGTGGHVDICGLLLQHENSKEYVNRLTFDGNSALMWAAWSGTIDTVKFLIRNRAEAGGKNRNGCTVAHWAASGGNLEVCKYLADVAHVDFSVPNNGGNTPLTHAVAFGRAEVVSWLRSEVLEERDSSIALDLARDFVAWTGDDSNRKQVLQMFEDD